MLSGVSVYWIVWSLWMSSSKLRATSILERVVSSDVLNGFSLVVEALEVEPDVCCCLVAMLPESCDRKGSEGLRLRDCSTDTWPMVDG